MGKPFTGKQTQAELLAAKHCLTILDVHTLVTQALEAAEASEGSTSSRTKSKKGKKAGNNQPPQVVLGLALKKLVSRGKVVPDDLYVSLIVDAITRLLPKDNSDNTSTNGSSDPANPKFQLNLDELSEIKEIGSNDPNDNDAISSGSALAEGAEGSEKPAKSGGWILLGFPETLAQATLLEKELSGFELPKQKKAGAPKVTKNKKERRPSRLARPLSPVPRTDPHPSGITMVTPHNTDSFG